MSNDERLRNIKVGQRIPVENLEGKIIGVYEVESIGTEEVASKSSTETLPVIHVKSVDESSSKPTQ